MDSNTQQKVQDLAAGWANFLSGQMSLNKDTFQLAQGNLGLQTSDNSGLFLMADAVPPPSSVAYYDSSSMRKRSDAYGLLLSALLPETNPNALRNALANYYNDWVTWKLKNPPTSGEDYLAYFNRWAMQSNIDPGTVARAKSAIIAAQSTPLIKALTNYNDTAAFQQQFSPAGQPPFSLYVNSATSDNAMQAINNGQSIENFKFDSNSMDINVSRNFVQGSASGFYDIFSGGAGASFETLNTKAASSRFTITGRIGKFATLACGPGGWYSSAEVDRAFHSPNDNTIWDPGSSAGNWGSFFGQPNGSLARYVSQLILVSDYSVTVTSYASYSQEDYQNIKTHASFGIWPFFSADVSSTQTTDIVHNEDATLSVTHSLNKGLIQIWGVNVLSQS
ncbi:MAG TPA: hypothetical protein VFN30_00895 [Chitinophagaceae bacterium]|nr:hypothetical protein [Chitinophagaceae bacterium]